MSKLQVVSDMIWHRRTWKPMQLPIEFQVCMYLSDKSLQPRGLFIRLFGTSATSFAGCFPIEWTIWDAINMLMADTLPQIQAILALSFLHSTLFNLVWIRLPKHSRTISHQRFVFQLRFLLKVVLAIGRQSPRSPFNMELPWKNAGTDLKTAVAARCGRSLHWNCFGHCNWPGAGNLNCNSSCFMTGSWTAK